jgi:hypothetical protein
MVMREISEFNQIEDAHFVVGLYELLVAPQP